MISAGATVPVAYIAEGDIASDFGLDEVFGPENFTPIPYGAFDFALSDSIYLGASVWYVDVNGSSTAGFVSPRLEIALDDAQRLAFSLDATLGLVSRERDETDVLDLAPWFMPSVGLRWSIPTGFGGLIVSQQVSTSIVTWGLPGSIAYDIPVSLGEKVRLHFFPEFRWDPVLVLTEIDNTSGALIPLSAGLAIMLEVGS